MTSFFKEITRTEPHTIAEISNSLDQDLAEHKQLIPILKEHHHFIEESLSYLIDRDVTDMQKQEHLERVLILMEMHGRTEEEILYASLLACAEKIARVESLSCQDEHDIIFQTGEELIELNYKYLWSEEVDAKAKVFANLIKNHLKEEEHILFPLATSHLTIEELDGMRDEYILNCKSYLDAEKNDFIGRKGWIVDVYDEGRE